MAVEHVERIRVAWVDTDAGGRIHFSNAFRWAEQAETALRRELGILDGWGDYPRKHAEAEFHRVLRFEDCIQCEACMFACPTEALVMFPEGAVPPPLKVPEMDENFQTAVPGQYLIGEVAGKPLVKNAANLGRAVVEHMLGNGMRAGALGGVPEVDVAIVARR